MFVGFFTIIIVAVGVIVAGLLSGNAAPGVAGDWADPFAARSLDSAAPEFPVPAEAVLDNAYVEGSGAAAYRLASWTSPLDVDETTAFFANLREPRWQAHGERVATADGTTFQFIDARDVFARVVVDVTTTRPVRIAIRFIPPGDLPAPTANVALETAMPLGTLPPLTELSRDLPEWATPPGGTLVDAAEVDGTVLAIFDMRGDVSSLQRVYVDTLTEAGVAHTIEPFASGVMFRIGDGPDRIILEAVDGGVRVSLAVTP